MEMNRHNHHDCENGRENNRGRNREFREICVNGILFRYRLNEIREGVSELVAVPCQQPTLILCVAEIKRKENCCMNMDYFQATINNHCVEIIQDCSLEEIIKEAIRIYVENSELVCAGNGRRNRLTF